MDDLEITWACAEAMGYVLHKPKNKYDRIIIFTLDGSVLFDPLHDDAQAMALIRKCGLNIKFGGLKKWTVSSNNEEQMAIGSDDLNLAICEFVSRIKT